MSGRSTAASTRRWRRCSSTTASASSPIQDIPDADLAAAAVPFFAAKLSVPAPSGADFDLPPHRVPVLVLHAAALVAVLRSMTSPPGPLRVAVTEGVLDELLAHEAGYWRRSVASCGLPDDGRVIKPVVAAAILLGADSLEEAAAVAGRVPDLGHAPAGDLRRWARWLYDLYPAGPAGQLGTVQPDLLAEHHAATQLTADPTLARAILADLTPHPRPGQPGPDRPGAGVETARGHRTGDRDGPARISRRAGPPCR